jgi:hypothetical protein
MPPKGAASRFNEVFHIHVPCLFELTSIKAAPLLINGRGRLPYDCFIKCLSCEASLTDFNLLSMYYDRIAKIGWMIMPCDDELRKLHTLELISIIDHIPGDHFAMRGLVKHMCQRHADVADIISCIRRLANRTKPGDFNSILSNAFNCLTSEKAVRDVLYSYGTCCTVGEEDDDYACIMHICGIKNIIYDEDLVIDESRIPQIISCTADTEDAELIERLTGKKSIVLINKIDLVRSEELDSLRSRLSGKTTLEVSVLNDKGIDNIEDTIADMFFKGKISQNDEVLITNIRHKSLVDKAIRDIEQAVLSFESGMPLDIIAIDIKNAAENIGQITGESITEAVMHNIFSRFCIGK